MKNKLADIKLECGHIIVFNCPLPFVREMVWCYKCNKTREVRTSPRGRITYKAKCNSCKWWHYSEILISCTGQAKMHVSKNVTHIVRIKEPWSGGVCETIAYREPTLDSQLPPPY